MNAQKMTEINDTNPTSLGNMIGQQGVIKQVRVALNAANEDEKKFDHSMLVGPPGLGKSQTARIISSEMGTELHEVLGQSIAKPADLNGLLLAAKDKDVIHIDECHELQKEFQTALYIALDQRRVILQTRTKTGPQSISLRDFTLLLSTTDEYGLLQPLRDRMKLTLRFDFYSDEELTTILLQRSQALGWPIDERIIPFIAERSRGTPRLALRLLQACRRVCRADQQTKITTDHFLRAVDMEEIDQKGLGPVEQKYLDLLLLLQGGCGLWTISSTLGVPARTLSHVVEPYLFRKGLIMKDEKNRRELTKSGRKYLELKHGN